MIPHVFHPVKNNDFTLNVITAHKRFVLDSNSTTTTSSGYFLWDGLYSGLKTPIGDARSNNDPTNSCDGSYKHDIWKFIDARYYRFPYDYTSTMEHFNERLTFKNIGITASILSFPYFDYGHAIQPGSVEVTNSFFNLTLTDDENGNLYDRTINTGSFSPRQNVVGYWGFNDGYRTYKRWTSDSNAFKDTSINFVSRTFTPDVPTIGKHIKYNHGVFVNATASGCSVGFDGTGYLLTKNRDEFNFSSIDDFTISFWFEGDEDTQNNLDYIYNTLISKKGTIYKQELSSQIVSASYVDEPTNVYPYNFKIYNESSAMAGFLQFDRSDGINICSLTSSYTSGQFNHVCATKSGSLLSLYMNGALAATTTDRTNHPINRHSILFGSDNQNLQSSFTGLMDEIRIYDIALNASQVATLADNTNQSLYQTAVVGNVFYKSGNIVISGFDPKYNNIFQQNQWSVKYRGSHDIYNYECLVRIPAGSFNLSQNPTARQSPTSDLIINDMTGSLEDGALFPYATTIGLYSPSGDLLVIGKLSQPLQMRDDVNMNILLKIDA